MSVDSTVRRSGSHGAGTWGSFRFYSLSVLHNKPDRSSCHCGSGSALNVLNVDRWSPWFSQLLTIFRAQKAHETASLASCTEVYCLWMHPMQPMLNMRSIGWQRHVTTKKVTRQYSTRQLRQHDANIQFLLLFVSSLSLLLFWALTGLENGFLHSKRKESTPYSLIIIKRKKNNSS